MLLLSLVLLHYRFLNQYTELKYKDDFIFFFFINNQTTKSNTRSLSPMERLETQV